MRTMKKELGIITGEAMNNAEKGKTFSVIIPSESLEADNLDISGCKCGPSYAGYERWSVCCGVHDEKGGTVIEFSCGEWLKDAVPCFMDLYMMLPEKSGKMRAGSVKVRVRS